MNNQQLVDKLYTQVNAVYEINQDVAIQLAKYVTLLLKWNKVYSLTAITDIDEVIKLHIVDGLSIMPYLRNINSIVDVGSGMGVPGILIAIIYPQIRVVLVDINSKKTTFLKQVAIELHLNNVEIVTKKIENYTCNTKFDVAISRAFTSSRMFIDLTKHLLNEHNSSWLLMKSVQIDNEVAQIADYKYDIIDLDMYDIIGERYLLKIYNKVI